MSDTSWEGIPLAISEVGAQRLASFAYSHESPTVEAKYRVEGSTALIPVCGPILGLQGTASYEGLLASLREANGDPAVTSIALELDSPGGLVKGVYSAAKAIQASAKPVHAVVTGEACSAAYWLAAACVDITADPTAIIGCLGVMTTVVEMPTEMGGIKAVKFVSSSTPLKAPAPSSDAGKDQFQSIVDTQANLFLDEVARMRGVDRATIDEKYGKGLAFAASTALELGMVDALTDELGAVAPGGTEMADNTSTAAPVAAEMTPDEKIAELEAVILELTKKLEEATASKAEDMPEDDKVEEVVEEVVAEAEAAPTALVERIAALEALNLKMEGEAVVSKLVAEGKVTPAEQPMALKAYFAEKRDPSVDLFSTMFANRGVQVALNTRVSHGAEPQKPTVTVSDDDKFMTAALAHCAKHGIDPEGPGFAQAVVAVSTGFAG